MNLEQEIRKLASLLEQLQTMIQSILPDSPQAKHINELIEDIQQDYYTIAVVGEFKNGKSTFVNALLEQELMPVDVTPMTAAINAVFYGETPSLQILKTSGVMEEQPLSRETLQAYTARGDFNPDDVKYLKIHVPSPLLKNRVVLVDTPGVNDLNKHREDITMKFIPRADVVLFMLDITAPVKRTEEQFLRGTLLNQGIDNIVYVANFMDRLEEEEIDDTMDVIARRIANIIGQKEPALFPLSALHALEGKLSGDKDLIHCSGMSALEEKIQLMIKSGARSQEKWLRYRQRFSNILESLREEITTVESLSKSSLAQLQAHLEAVHSWKGQNEKWEGLIEVYLREREEELQFMVSRSIDAFANRMREDLTSRVQLFQGADIKNLIESQIPVAIRTHLTNWLEQYGDAIHDFLRKVEREVSKGLSAAFQQNVQVKAQYGSAHDFTETVPIPFSSSGNASVKAGLVVGGASALLMLLGGGFLVPVIAMAGIPGLQQLIAERQLENQKPQLLTVLNDHLDALLKEFRHRLAGYVHQSFEQIRTESLQHFTKHMAFVVRIIEEEIAKKSQQSQDERQYQEKLNSILEWIDSNHHLDLKKGEDIYEPVCES
ncbi:dynamin family protein [Brevibacillus choshinensis]|uniref:dynamin family protein n=1 Tax=Brevibacillus choshinensis TaxID=54911 RepID=UPI002E1E1FE8|nr:dynamin family protein [Brevibacillus choshinensis]